ncbi:MAG TPA: protein-glutamate O-methyltransferase CheR [Candidatus Kryptobacter bacterium]|nr:protein-glutamate O-methyltransferase CheR [Candidatus Kryptobacter bacterium]
MLYPQSNKLPDDLFQQLRKLIYEHTGIFFADNKKYLLESRVSRRLTAMGVNTFKDYYGELMNGAGPTEIPHLINAITINETFFFRNEPQFAALEGTILPELIEKKRQSGSNKVRIWSAASSTGEEPYTIGLIIKEKFQPRFPGMKFELVGTDINTQVLDVARRGIYKEYSIRNTPKNYLDRYFKQDEDKFVLNEEIRKAAEFRQLNLFDKNGMKMMRDFDVVFAANVLIYFDFNSKQAVVSSIYNSLNRGGYFFVGYSETLYGLSQAFKPVHYDKAIAYRKE